MADAAPLSPSARRVQDALDALGIASRVVEHAASARTSAEAAAVLGCTVAEIAKSLVFRTGEHGGVLVVASGAHRVDEARVAAALGAPVRKADAAFVRATTGYAIGGIPPFGHATRLPTIVDAELMRHPTVYAAGGTPSAMFPIAPADLVRASGGLVAEVALLASGETP